MASHTRKTLITAAAADPLSLVDLKDYLRITSSDEDELLAQLIRTATEHIENTESLACITQTWDVYFDTFDCELILPLPPIAATTPITWVHYVDLDGVTQTVTSTVYETAERNGVGRVRLAYNQDWPTGYRGHRDDVIVRMVCGYGASAASVPFGIRQAIKYLAAHWYENRVHINIGNIVNPLPLTVDALLAPFRRHYLV